MSGGSFDYVCFDMEDAEWSQRSKLKLIEMRDYCREYFPDAVPHIEDMLQFILAFDEQYLTKGKRIHDLLKSIEWYASSDWGPDAVQDALNKLKSQETP